LDREQSNDPLKLTQLRSRFETPRDRLTSADTLPKLRELHYGTPEHKAWSKLVVGRANGVCQCCGKVTKKLIADHLHERRDGGDPFDPANGKAVCWACHNTKTAAAKRARALGMPLNAPRGGR
jgi:5-methylcytosine-specific restriction enzyme A